MKTTAIIPVWNGNSDQHYWTMQNASTLLACHNIHAIYIDNASPFPPTLTYLRKMHALHPETMTLIENTENNGYGGALNQGLLLAYQRGDEFFICLNNDIEFQTPTWHMPLVETYKEFRHVLIGQMLVPNNRWVFFDSEHHRYLQGHCLAFGREFLEEVGFFDEIFFPAWAEDVELSWRAEMQHYTLLTIPDLALYHAGGKTGYDGRVGEYVSEMEWKLGPPKHLRGMPENIRTAGIVTERNVELFRNKVRSGNLDWQGPHVWKESA